MQWIHEWKKVWDHEVVNNSSSNHIRDWNENNFSRMTRISSNKFVNVALTKCLANMRIWRGAPSNVENNETRGWRILRMDVGQG